MQSTFVVLGIVAGVILGVLSNWIYDILRNRGYLPNRPSIKRFVIIVFVFFPIIIFVALPTLLKWGDSDSESIVDHNRIVEDQSIAVDGNFEGNTVIQIGQGDVNILPSDLPPTASTTLDTDIAESPDVKFEFTTWSTGIYRCKDSLDNEYLSYLWKANDVLITNSSGELTSLTNIEFIQKDIRWTSLVFTDSSLKQKIELPLDIPSGASRRVFLTALNLLSRRKSPNDGDGDDITLSDNSSWELKFGNEESKSYMDPVSSLLSPYYLFDQEEECIYVHKPYYSP